VAGGGSDTTAKGAGDWTSCQRVPRQRALGLDALRACLVEAGYEEGRNLTIEYRFGIGERLSALAADLANRQVAVIVATGAQGPILAAKATRRPDEL
jgi:hypothetical protein